MTDKENLVSKNMEIEFIYTAQNLESISAAKAFFTKSADKILRERSYKATLHYYDTAELDLLKTDIIFRTLDAAQPYFGSRLFIKGNNPPKDGLFDRQEYNFSVSADGLNLDEIRRQPAFALLKPADGKELQEFFKTVTTREEVRGQFGINGKKAMLECSLDSVDFTDSKTGALLKKVYEVEIEFKQNYSDPAITREEAVALLREIGSILQKNIADLSISQNSKADIGFSFFVKKILPTAIPAQKTPKLSGP